MEVDEDGNEIVASEEDDEEKAIDATDLAPTKAKKKFAKESSPTASDEIHQKAYENEGIRNLSYVVGFFLAGTLGWSIYKVYRRSTS